MTRLVSQSELLLDMHAELKRLRREIKDLSQEIKRLRRAVRALASSSDDTAEDEGDEQ